MVRSPNASDRARRRRTDPVCAPSGARPPASRANGEPGQIESWRSKRGSRSIAVGCKFAVVTGMLGACAWTHAPRVAPATTSTSVQLNGVPAGGHRFAAEPAVAPATTSTSVQLSGVPAGRYRFAAEPAVAPPTTSFTLQLNGVPAGRHRFAAGPAPVPAPTTSPVQMGIIGASGNYFAAEHAAGLQLVEIGVSWSLAEPASGVFDTVYLSSVRAEIAEARSRSFGVVLDPGLQYPPAWVFSLPGGTRFVDQYGDVYTGPVGSGDDVANAVTDTAVRAAEAAYLRDLSAQIPGTLLSAVRTGGGPDGELRYPTGEYNGHLDAFWAYDSSSQAASPIPGWQPGTGTQADAATFLATYNHNINAYGVWLDNQMAADFDTRQLIMLPGWGERPGAASEEVSDRLTLGYDEFSQGLDWADLLPSLPNRDDLVAYTTYLDGPTVEPTLQLEDPISYIAYLDKSLGIPLGGENTGNGSIPTLDLVVSRALSLHLVLVAWMDEAQVVAASAGSDPAHSVGPTFASLAAAATSLRHP